jgi:hypothetical protein
MFGFSDTTVQEILKNMPNNTKGTNIVFEKSPGSKSTQKHEIEIKTEPEQKKNKNQLSLFHGMTAEQVKQKLYILKMKTLNEIAELEHKKELILMNKKRKRENDNLNPVYDQDPIRRENEKRQKLSQHQSSQPSDSQDLLLIDIYSETRKSDEIRKQKREAERNVNNNDTVVQPEKITQVPESQIVETSEDNNSQTSSFSQRIVAESRRVRRSISSDLDRIGLTSVPEETTTTAAQEMDIEETQVEKPIVETSAPIQEEIKPVHKQVEPVVGVTIKQETEEEEDTITKMVDQLVPSKSSLPSQETIDDQTLITPIRFSAPDNIFEKSMVLDESLLSSSMTDEDETVNIQEIVKSDTDPVAAVVDQNKMDDDTQHDDETVTVTIPNKHNNSPTPEMEVNDEHDDFDSDDDKTKNLEELPQLYPDQNSKKSSLMESAEYLNKLNETKEPFSPPNGADKDQDELEMPAECPDSPILLGEEEDKQDNHEDGQEDVHEDREDEQATLSPLPTIVPPKASQHSLPQHPITRINLENDLKLHSKFNAKGSVLSAEFSPVQNDARFVLCTETLVKVFELNGKAWEVTEDIVLADPKSEQFLIAKFVPNGDKLVVAGKFAESIATDETETVTKTSYSIRIYDLNGESIFNHCLITRNNVLEPLITLTGHNNKILDVFIAQVHRRAIICSSDEAGKVILYALESDFASKNAEIELKRQNNEPVISLNLLPQNKTRAPLLIGSTKSSISVWNAITGAYAHTWSIPASMHIHKSTLLMVQEPDDRNFLLGFASLFEMAIGSSTQQTPSQEAIVKQAGVLSVGTKQACKVTAIYKRKDNPSQTQSSSATQPARDNLTAMSTHPSSQSLYLVTGTDRGRVLIFNYRYGQCVGILVDMDGDRVTSLGFHKHLPLMVTAGESGNVYIYYQVR